jgi:hypothetical protein
MSLSPGRGGVSAIFDALLFFIIISAACTALYYPASRISISLSDDAATRHLGQQAADIHACALESTVGPVEYSVNGTKGSFTGTAIEGIREILRVRAFSSVYNVSGIEEGVRGAYSLLVDKPYRFAVQAHVPGWKGSILIWDPPELPLNMGQVRWTSTVTLIVDDSQGDLTLYMWR